MMCLVFLIFRIKRCNFAVHKRVFMVYRNKQTIKSVSNIKRTFISLLFFLVCMLVSQGIMSQGVASYASNIRSIQVEPNGEWGVPPVILLDGNDYVDISFDDVQHNYIRRIYRIVHCNADWTPSNLIENEYMDGFNDNVIDDYVQSMNTETEYNHYMITIPNDDVTLKAYGNYKVEILNDGEDEPVATACFCVAEQRVNIYAEVTSNTDIDTNGQHQQLSFKIDYNGYQLVNPTADLYIRVLQNGRWDNRVENLRPTYMRNNELEYTHNRNLIFEAGNEYRRFEILDEKVPTMRVDRMEYIAPYYHATLFTDSNRKNYVFDMDQNGRYYIRNKYDEDSESESDYFLTHFTLEIPKIGGGEVYLNGNLTENRFTERNQMVYNYMTHAYEIVLPLKQGSYNYQYLFVKDGENYGSGAMTEGNFYQTENEYWIFVYHRPFGSKYDRLIGFQTIDFNEQQ